MCFFNSPKMSVPQAAPPPPAAPLAPEIPTDPNGPKNAGNARKALRIDLAGPGSNVGGAGLNIPV